MFYGSMPKDDDISEDGKYPIFSGYRFVGYSNKKNIDEPTLIVVARGVGGTGDVKIAPANSFLTNLSIAVDIDENIADKKFLYYFLNVQGLRYLDTGAAQSQITINNLKRHSMLLPDLSSQKRIADILSTYDELIENNNQRIKLLEQIAENLYKEWFVRFRFPGYETAKFENGLPEGWQVRRIGDISKIGSGGDAPKDYSPVRTPEYSVPIFSNGITNDGLYGFAKKGTKKAKSITISARGTVGFTCLRFEPYLPIVRLLSIEPDNKDIDVYYLYYNLRNDMIDGYGTSQQQITIPFFSKKKIIVPSMALQNQYAAIVEEIYNQINKLKDMNNNLVKQRDLLLPRLMSGKLEV